MRTTTRGVGTVTVALAALTLTAPAHAGPDAGSAPGGAADRAAVRWSPPSGSWDVHGDILAAWERTGREAGPLGSPTTDETRTPDGRGAYNVFQGGSIYWSPATAAHDVRGAIRDAWARAGWEGGVLGFPLTGETRTPDGHGAYNVFQGGSVYWSPVTGAHVVLGAIRDAWAAQGHENGPLGFPTSGEFDVPGGRRSDFQGGFVEWSPLTGARVVLDVATPYPWLPPTAPAPSTPAHYADCDAARAAGAAPLHVGQPGYRRYLDRDGDGVACE
ncbi:excalibur calcium-binding domain-containing protein [Kineococcus gypseus]|uniref:excalibur calcium-binding domain-containing protein n=1 Tax=Kineococcus gypseus TaxID=1637102 RepID=UPI003D7D2C1E